jgi:hypothetical protein
VAITNGVVPVGTAAILICAASAGAMVQNIGTVAVTIGGPTVTVGHGPTLPPSMTQPILIPEVNNSAGDDYGIYGIAASGLQSVLFLAASFGG